MLFAVGTNISALAVRFDGCTERVIRIILDGLEDLHLGCTRRLIGIKDNINTLRQVIRIYGHALQVVAVIHHNTNLRIMGIAQIQIRDAATNLHHTVFCKTAFVAIAHCYTI